MNSRFLAITLLALLGAGTGRAADVSFFGVLKSQFFNQTNANSTVAWPSNGFGFQAFVVPSGSNTVLGATVRVPSTPAKTNLLEPGLGGLGWGFLTNFNTQSALDAAYPVGSPFPNLNYTLRMQTLNDGTRSVNVNFALLTLVGNPGVPRLTNFAAAQAIDHTREFALRWTAGTGLALDIVQVTIFDSVSNLVFASPPPFSPGALTGQSNSLVIPSYVLPPDMPLTARITIVRPAGIETNAYPGVFGVAGVVRDTGVQMRTRPAPVPPELSVLSPAGPLFRAEVLAEPQRIYQVESSPDLTGWSVLLTTNLATGTGFRFSDPRTTRQFYRVRVGTE